jgi:integrase
MPRRNPYDQAYSQAYCNDLAREYLAIRHRALEPSTRASQNSMLRSYYTFCARTGLPPLPFCSFVVGLFFVEFMRHGNRASSLKTYVAAFKRHSCEVGQPWLSDLEQFRLNDLLRGLGKTDRRPSNQKLPITMEVLRAMLAHADTRMVLWQVVAAMAAMGHDGLFRGGELTALTIGDITWGDERRACWVRLRSSKMRLAGAPEYVPLADYGPMSAVAWLRDLWGLLEVDARLAADPATASRPLFPLVDARGQVRASAFFGKAAFVRACQQLLRAAGYPHQRYSGHSFRSGGATDLWNGGVQPRLIQLQGRWRSDAMYLYIRDNPQTRLDVVAAAFALAAGDDCMAPQH